MPAPTFVARYELFYVDRKPCTAWRARCSDNWKSRPSGSISENRLAQNWRSPPGPVRSVCVSGWVILKRVREIRSYAHLWLFAYSEHWSHTAVCFAELMPSTSSWLESSVNIDSWTNRTDVRTMTSDDHHRTCCHVTYHVIIGCLLIAQLLSNYWLVECALFL